MTPALQFALHGVGAEASLNLQDLGEVLFLQITGLHLHSQVGQMKVTSSPLLPSKLSHPGLRSVSLNISLTMPRAYFTGGPSGAPGVGLGFQHLAVGGESLLLNQDYAVFGHGVHLLLRH